MNPETPQGPEVLRIVARCEALFDDLHFNSVKAWKAARDWGKWARDNPDAWAVVQEVIRLRESD